MVQFIPARNDWANAFQKIGQGVSEGYMQRTDEKALQSSLEKLGPNPTARQILDTVTNTKTYSPEAKQNVLKNYLGVAEFEELQRKHKESELIDQAKNRLEKMRIESTDKKTSLQNKELEFKTKKAALENKELELKTKKAESEIKDKEDKLKKEKEDKEEERKRVKSIVKELPLTEEQKEALGDSLSVKAAEDLVKEHLFPKTKDAKLTPFQKAIQQEHANQYIKATEDIPKLQTTIEDIDHVRSLSDKLSKTENFGGQVGINSEQAQEMESKSFPLIEQIVKVFNPSGPIAQQKLKLIQDKYTIKASDLPWIRTAKLNALEYYSKQALKRTQEKKTLIEKYEGSPPESEVNRFEKESDTLSDAMMDYELAGEEINEGHELSGTPPIDWKGKTVTSTSGQKYYSDGTRWVKR